MNQIRKLALLLALIGTSIYQENLWACPCGAEYTYYYLVMTSGTDRDAVIASGIKISKALDHKFSYEAEFIESRRKICGENSTNCMFLLTSDDEPIGKNGWTFSKSSDQTKTYAVVYAFTSFDTKKNKTSAEKLRRKIQSTAKNAYLKPFKACVCE